MQSSTAKKVVVHRYQREPVLGYVHPNAFLHPDGAEVLLPNGVLQRLSYAEIKQIWFVKDFDAGRAQPDQRTFQSRPKLEGLWVRVDFLDGDMQEGVLANNLVATDGAGFTITPPNSAGNTQRIFVPRGAIRALTVLAVVGLRTTKKPKVALSDGQPSLFTEE
ncbi:MAG: hypothetical protein MUF01_10175 [Bryobacterales bacterium]|nr:hypothetical protein [Bryobacterales bacterium]